MSEAKHEPEPWILGGCSGRAVTTPSGYAGDGFIADVDTLANAARIVACVNGCKGINPEAVGDLLEACKSVYMLQGQVHADFIRIEEAIAKATEGEGPA